MKLKKKDVALLFSVYEHQADILIHLYRMVFPNWDDIERMDGWPKVNKATSRWIWDKFVAFDKVYHPDVMNGGAWFNSGFSCQESEGLKNWEVRPCPVTLKA
jgi:hypothetical protein